MIIWSIDFTSFFPSPYPQLFSKIENERKKKIERNENQKRMRQLEFESDPDLLRWKVGVKK